MHARGDRRQPDGAHAVEQGLALAQGRRAPAARRACAECTLRGSSMVSEAGMGFSFVPPGRSHGLARNVVDRREPVVGRAGAEGMPLA